MEKLSVPAEFKFPFTPYPIQIDFMRQLYETVEAGQVGIFESPTGTGLFFAKSNLFNFVRNERKMVI